MIFLKIFGIKADSFQIIGDEDEEIDSKNLI